MARGRSGIAWLLGLALACGGASGALAQGANVLVIDASSSMWGRVADRPKIEIAREASRAYLDRLPAGARLSVVAYGHRRAGDCGDIEAVVPLAPLDRARAQAAIDRLAPRGKTPIAEALRTAAGQVDPAAGGRIVIVTDGIETCGGDPCRLAAELKARNAGLVVHVVGFDLKTKSEQAKVACIAERTGGSFVAADDAGALAAALENAVAAPPKPVAALRPVALRATDGPGGRALPNAFFTIVREADAAIVAEAIMNAAALAPGRYAVTAWSDIKTGSATVTVTATAPAEIVVALTGALPSARIVPRAARAAATGILEVEWSGPDEEFDHIQFARIDGEAAETRHYGYTRDGNPAKVRVPGDPGRYELRYVFARHGIVLARAPVEVTPVTATVAAPAAGAAGAEIEVVWSGPNALEDFVAIVPPEAGPGAQGAGGTYYYTAYGSPLRIALPAAPGRYEVRYVSGLDARVLARAAIEAR